MERTFMNINDIKIYKSFIKSGINPKKLSERRYHYYASGEFLVEVFIDKKGFLIDGYTTYVLAKEDNITNIPVIFVKDENQKAVYDYLQNKILKLEEELLENTFGIFNKIKLKRKIKILESVKEEMFINEK